jgi:hypothetical protein
MTSKARTSSTDPGREEPLAWDQRILERIDSGIDPASIAENLERTPAERLARLQQMLRFLEQARRDGHPETA